MKNSIQKKSRSSSCSKIQSNFYNNGIRLKVNYKNCKNAGTYNTG